MQRLNLAGGLAAAGVFPILRQFRAVQRQPFQDQMIGTRGKLSSQDRAILNRNLRPIPGVVSVKMRSVPLIKAHHDFDSVELADRGHCGIP